jgi:hypothetical protein
VRAGALVLEPEPGPSELGCGPGARGGRQAEPEREEEQLEQQAFFYTKDFKMYRLQSDFSYKLSLAPRTQRSSLQSWQIVECLRDVVQERTHAIVRRKG